MVKGLLYVGGCLFLAALLASWISEEAALTSQVNKLAIYEAPYDELIVLDEPPQPDETCGMCCCHKSLKVCHVSCIEYKGGTNGQCQSLCAMKARGMTMPLERPSGR